MQASFVCSFVWSVYMISASNLQTPYKKLTRIVKGPNIFPIITIMKTAFIFSDACVSFLPAHTETSLPITPKTLPFQGKNTVEAETKKKNNGLMKSFQTLPQRMPESGGYPKKNVKNP